jgi:hypothetical protein
VVYGFKVRWPEAREKETWVGLGWVAADRKLQVFEGFGVATTFVAQPHETFPPKRP